MSSVHQDFWGERPGGAALDIPRVAPIPLTGSDRLRYSYYSEQKID